MTPYSGLGFFFTLALALLPAAIAGLRGKNLRVCGFAVTAVMLLLIFDTPKPCLRLWITASCTANPAPSSTPTAT